MTIVTIVTVVTVVTIVTMFSKIQIVLPPVKSFPCFAQFMAGHNVHTRTLRRC